MQRPHQGRNLVVSSGGGGGGGGGGGLGVHVVIILVGSHRLFGMVSWLPDGTGDKKNCFCLGALDATDKHSSRNTDSFTSYVM